MGVTFDSSKPIGELKSDGRISGILQLFICKIRYS